MLSDETRRRLLAADVDPDAVAGLVRMAVAEDLMGGADVTTIATVPATQRSVATFISRGVLAGLAAAATIDAVCGDAASDVKYLVADGELVDPGREVARVVACIVHEETSAGEGVGPAAGEGGDPEIRAILKPYLISFRHGRGEADSELHTRLPGTRFSICSIRHTWIRWGSTPES